MRSFRSVCAVGCFAIVALAAPGLRAQPLARPARPGPGLAVGLGNAFAGVGLQALYFLPRPGSRLALTPGLAIGFISGLFDSDRALDDGANRVVGFSANLTGSFGYRHRVAADVGVGLVGGAAVVLQGVVVDSVPIYAAYVQGGYEFVGTSGILFRFWPLGVGYAVNDPLGGGDRVHLVASMGLGWKLW